MGLSFLETEARMQINMDGGGEALQLEISTCLAES